MLKSKKGVELPITAIIIFVIVLVVAVVMIVIFVRQTGKGSEQISGCTLKQGSCSQTLSPNFNENCPSGYVSLGGTPDCKVGDTQNKCCLTVTG